MKDVVPATPVRKDGPGRKKARPVPATKDAAQQPGTAGPRTMPQEIPKSASRAGVNGKEKLVRDSFTMPRADLQLIKQLQARAIAFHRPAKKSELLRAGLHALAALTDEHLRASLDGLTPLKPGRPKKSA